VISKIARRLYEDFLMPSRLSEYAELIKMALAKNYTVLPIDQYLQSIKEDHVKWEKLLILRHDVDSDVETAKHMFDIECEFGIQASYYFRLQTVDTDFMRRIVNAGGEVGYHFEEIATFIKKKGLRNREEVTKCLPEIRDLFRRNLLSLRSRTGLPIRIVAAHGDWINRRLRIFNFELLNDELRYELAIEAETYDPWLASGITWRISDGVFPNFWNPIDPKVAFTQDSPAIYILTHPRHWVSNARENLKMGLTRATEACRYRLLTALAVNGSSHRIP